MSGLRDILSDSFEIDSPIESGGQGHVYRGTYKGHPAAIKLFNPSGDERRIERELELLQELDIPSVVKILHHEQVELDGEPIHVVAYELHNGGDLRNGIDGLPAQDTGFDVIRELGLCISTAIEQIWNRRVVHRDIKPANILRRSDGGFVLVDFGFARYVDRSDVTAIGASPGTRGYMSPEQARGRKALTHKSDIFSLGVTLFEVSAGQHPFNTNQALIGTRDPTSLGILRPDLPKSLSNLVHKMLSVTPSSRPSRILSLFKDMES